jgi:hypothetical protein
LERGERSAARERRREGGRERERGRGGERAVPMQVQRRDGAAGAVRRRVVHAVRPTATNSYKVIMDVRSCAARLAVSPL